VIRPVKPGTGRGKAPKKAPTKQYTGSLHLPGVQIVAPYDDSCKINLGNLSVLKVEFAKVSLISVPTSPRAVSLISHGDVPYGSNLTFVFNMSIKAQFQLDCSCPRKEATPVVFNYTFRQKLTVYNTTIGFSLFNISLPEIPHFRELLASFATNAIARRFDYPKQRLRERILNYTFARMECTVATLKANESAASAVVAGTLKFQHAVSDVLTATKANLDQAVAPALIPLINILEVGPRKLGGRVRRPDIVNFCKFDPVWGLNARFDRCICDVDGTNHVDNATCSYIGLLYGANVSNHNFHSSICHPMVCEPVNKTWPVMMAKLKAMYDGFDHDHAVRIKTLIQTAMEKDYPNTTVEILMVKPDMSGHAKMVFQYSVHGNSTRKISSAAFDSMLRENDPSHQIVHLAALDSSVPYGPTSVETAVAATVGAGFIITMLATAYVVYAKTVPVQAVAIPHPDGVPYVGV